MSSFPPKTFTLAEFESLGYLFRVCINFTAIQHLAVPAMASTSGVQRCPVHAQQIWDPLNGCIRFTAYAQVSCQQACTASASREPTAAKKRHWQKCGSMWTFPLSSKKPLQGRLKKGHDTFPAVIPRGPQQTQRTYCICSWWREYWDFLLHRKTQVLFVCSFAFLF